MCDLHRSHALLHRKISKIIINNIRLFIITLQISMPYQYGEYQGMGVVLLLLAIKILLYLPTELIFELEPRYVGR